MKKRVLCAAIASMMVLSMAACSSGSTAATTAETKAPEAETTTVAASSEKAEDATAAGTEGGTLIVGFDQDFPPMGFLGDNNEYTGFDLELAQEVAKRLGLEYQAQPIAWDAKDMELKLYNYY